MPFARVEITLVARGVLVTSTIDWGCDTSVGQDDTRVCLKRLSESRPKCQQIPSRIRSEPLFNSVCCYDVCLRVKVNA